MTKNEKAHLEANYKMHVEHMLKAEDAAKKNPRRTTPWKRYSYRQGAGTDEKR